MLSLPDHAWLDRVIRGRAWIPLLGVLLAGIVAAQVEILKLGASMGRSLEQTTSLAATNEQLRASVASLSDGDRIERLAAGMGLVAPPPGAVGYLTARRNGDMAGALANLHAPDPASFVALTPTNGAVVTGPGASTLPSGDGAQLDPAAPGNMTTATTNSVATGDSGSPASTPQGVPDTAAPQAPAGTASAASQGPAAGAAAIQPSEPSQQTPGG